jgi:tetratricopeptide (TPR) repeat protein
VRLEGYTDRKGRFNFDLGRSNELQDASDTSNSGAGIGAARDGQGGASRAGGMDRRFFGCEIRAVLPGYRSNAVSLANIRYLDNPDVGSIVLHRIGNGEGLTISATSALAPKDAQKAYAKALDAAAKGKREEAKANLEKAVALYPRYAAAWFELGKWNEQNSDFDTARSNYQQAVQADSKYLPPYERLSALAFKDKDWQHLSDYSAKLLSLDPLNYPDAYYTNGVAGLQLQQYDAAEKSLREAVRLDPEHKNPRAQYVLGLVLAQKHDYAAAAESIRAFLAASPSESDADFIRKQLAQIEKAAGNP